MTTHLVGQKSFISMPFLVGKISLVRFFFRNLIVYTMSIALYIFYATILRKGDDNNKI